MGRGLALIGAVAVVLGCSGLPFANPVVLRGELEGAEREAALGLVVDEVSGGFPPEIAADCAGNARAFTWLSVRAEGARTRTAALRALAGCHTAADREDAVAVAVGASDAEDRAELGAALALGGTLLAADEAPTLSTALLSRLDDPDPAVRYDAFVAVDSRSWGEDAATVAAVERILRAREPWLVTEALRRLRSRATGIADASGIETSVRLLLVDLDPGIRGRAAQVLVRLAPSDETVPVLVRGMLDDPHPYTRSAAAEALADLGHLPAVHDLVARLADRERNTWDMLPFTRLDGSEVIQHHVGSVFERVDDAFLRAIAELSGPVMGEQAFVYREVNLRYLSLDIIAATRDAARWYDEHKDAIPR